MLNLFQHLPGDGLVGSSVTENKLGLADAETSSA